MYKYSSVVYLCVCVYVYVYMYMYMYMYLCKYIVYLMTQEMIFHGVTRGSVVSIPLASKYHKIQITPEVSMNRYIDRYQGIYISIGSL